MQATHNPAPETAGTSIPADSTPAGAELTVADTFRATSLYLSRHGRVQGAYYDMDAVVFTPAACLVGGLAMVCYGGPVEAPAQMFGEPGHAEFEAAMAVLDRYLGLRYDIPSAYEFNDAKDRTLAEVHAALAAAANTEDVQAGRTVWSDLPNTAEVALAGTLTEIRHRASRQGHPYATGTLTTGHGVVPVEVPTLVYIDNAGHELNPGDQVWLSGMVVKGSHTATFWVQRIVPLTLQPTSSHVDYPHEPGRLYDCPACAAECFCTPDTTQCVYCAIEAEQGGDWDLSDLADPYLCAE